MMLALWWITTPLQATIKICLIISFDQTKKRFLLKAVIPYMLQRIHPLSKDDFDWEQSEVIGWIKIDYLIQQICLQAQRF